MLKTYPCLDCLVLLMYADIADPGEWNTDSCVLTRHLRGTGMLIVMVLPFSAQGNNTPFFKKRKLCMDVWHI